MEHTHAVSIGATERYLLGELDEQESAAFEEHFFSCAECAADLRAASAVADGATLVLGDDARPGDAPRPTARVLRGPVSWFWPMPSGAVAALLLACVGLAWQASVARDLRGELAAATAPQPAASAFLSASRSEVQEVAVRPDDRSVHLRLAPAEAAAPVHFHRYRLAEKDTGSVLWSTVHRAPRPGDESELNLSLKGLRPGLYVLELDGLQASTDPVGLPRLARYEFSLRYRGE